MIWIYIGLSISSFVFFFVVAKRETKKIFENEDKK